MSDHEQTDVRVLEEIVSTNLGRPAPVDTYHQPLDDAERAEFQEELDNIHSAHADAAAKLPTLFAG